MTIRKFVGLAGLLAGALCVLLVFASVASGQVKNVPIKPVDAASGAAMYKEYCAVCHGADGKGNGPAASALKVSTPDLTTLSKRNGGKFPALKVQNTVAGNPEVASHGSKEMPVWGTAFRSMEGDSRTQMRLFNLTKYLEGMQQK